MSFRVRNSGCELEKQIKSVSEDACNISEVSSLEGNLITSVSFDNSGGGAAELWCCSLLRQEQITTSHRNDWPFPGNGERQS